MSEIMRNANRGEAVSLSPLSSSVGQSPISTQKTSTRKSSYQWDAFSVTPRKRVLILGVGSVAKRLGRTLRRNRLHRYEVAGYVGVPASLVGRTSHRSMILGTFEQLPALVEQHAITTIAVCIQDQREVLPLDHLLALKTKGIDVLEGPRLQESLQKRFPYLESQPSRLIFSPHRPHFQTFPIVKRLLDIGGALAALLWLAPVLLLLGTIIKLESGGSVFTRTLSVGQYGQPFSLLRFRLPGLVDYPHAYQEKSVLRPICVWVGRKSQSLHLDTLPQLVNILFGQMSFVGPQSTPLSSQERQRTLGPYHALRRSVRPGMTGWAQVQTTRSLINDVYHRELQYDLYYVRNTSLWLDAYTLLRTIARLCKD